MKENSLKTFNLIQPLNTFKVFKEIIILLAEKKCLLNLFLVILGIRVTTEKKHLKSCNYIIHQ